MGVKKIMFILNRAPLGFEITATWGNIPISVVLRSEGSLKSEMLSLTQTSKYVNNTSVLSIDKTEEEASNSIVSVVINSYPCFLIDKIVPMRNQL